jgi:hypothetical protein
MDNKLGVIVPYRNREEHLTIFKQSIKEYLNNKNISFELIIVEQYDDKPFNRGKLLNIGFIEAERLKCNYVVFHDVDILPIEVDYSYSTNPINLITSFVSNSDYSKELFDGYFGGVTIFPTHLFKKINGYPNNFNGWGFEDDELFKRCVANGLNTDYIKHKNPIQIASGLQFFGENSYIKINNKLNYKKSIKISTTFKANTIINIDKDYDEYTIFSIPGYDLTLTYNSFGRYKFEFWDYKNNVYSITSKIMPSIFTKFEIEINPYECYVQMKQDNEIIDKIDFDRKLNDYSKENYFYIGNANPYRGINFKELYGYMCEFKVWNDDLPIIDLDFENYKWPGIRNKVNNIESEVFDCEKKDIVENEYQIIPIPKKRDGVFKLLEHENNGFSEGKWSQKETRENQIKFLNNLDQTGLKNIEYSVFNKTANHLLVKL